MEISKRNYNEECGQAQDVSPPCGVGAGAGGQHSIRLKILIVDTGFSCRFWSNYKDIHLIVALRIFF